MPAPRLRITGGSARGIPLAEPRGARLRPTSGLVREAVFNIIGSRVEGTRVLDLYAGTGALAIEALSRGAHQATLIEAEPGAIQAILQSLARTGFGESATVLRGRLPGALKMADGEFDLVFMDPPYRDEQAEETLRELGALLADGGVVVYEHGSRYNPPGRPGMLVLGDRRTYGDSAIAVYAKQERE
jgi:16S rRNA (guanine966-N2)-methyltransferase